VASLAQGVQDLEATDDQPHKIREALDALFFFLERFTRFEASGAELSALTLHAAQSMMPLLKLAFGSRRRGTHTSQPHTPARFSQWMEKGERVHLARLLPCISGAGIQNMCERAQVTRAIIGRCCHGMQALKGEASMYGRR
jgi:hypothetical protein